MQENIIYLAGPEVFYPDAAEKGRGNQYLCRHNFCIGLFPLDNEVDKTLPKEEQARLIVEGNMEMIRQAEMVFANLSNFRGTEEHPYCDSGTAWECGYAIGLGKQVIGYTTDPNSIPQDIINNIHLVVKTHPGNLHINEVFNVLNSVFLRTITPAPITVHHNSLLMDPPFPEIQDANSANAFWAGFYCAKGESCKLEISDTRSQVEKYGVIDANGNRVEDFGYPMNIMIALNADYNNS